jgi:endonuclease/exonuclease/phosphatase family metal-dependent hydrolase
LGVAGVTADKDVLIIGDFNTKSLDGEDFDLADSETVTNLESLSGFQSISKGHIEYTTPLSKEHYDHAFLSKDLREEELIAGSWNVRREVCETFPFRYLEHISNHCPVSLELSVTDNDPEPQGDWGIGN